MIDLNYFENKLLDLQEQILGVAELVDGAAGPVELDQNRVGRLSRMDAIQGQAMAQASSDRQHVQLQKIERSLAKIDAGDYGRCIDCDEFIAVARLEIDPIAELCINCAQALES